ncbi:MAG: acyl-CoA dehydratase activase-related protein [Oscillospiraceae bacterium]|nr:acyl-CoA dehydratase activase-related protein [Oscillospiraceae bacterium]
MNLDFMKEFHEYAGVKTVGIPRALQYYRYGRLWLEFFKGLGLECVVSEPTTKDILTAGVNRSIDEACYSIKVYFGHVDSLIGKCDAVFVPRIAGFGIRDKFCTRFEALYDVVSTVFADKGIRVITLSHDWHSENDIEEDYIELGMKLGKSKKEAKKAYSQAVKVAQQASQQEAKEQRRMTVSDDGGFKLLLAAHPYIAHDPYIGGQVESFLNGLGCKVLYVDRANTRAAVKRSQAIVSTLPWIESREILGTIDLYKNKLDGIILMSAYPCCTDSMANEYILRTVKNIPILQVTMDVQDGTAGLETRLESFVDIIKFRESGGYGN